MNIIMRAMFSSLLALFGIGCTGPGPTQRQTQTVNAADLNPNEVQHERLSEAQLGRITRLHEIFAEVDSSSLEKWIDNFKRDQDPDSEIAIWERIAKRYIDYCSQRNLSLDAKVDVFQTLVLRSMTSDEEQVKNLKLKALSLEEARKIMREY